MFIGTKKKMLLMLSLAPVLSGIAFNGAVLEQQFNKLTNGDCENIYSVSPL